MKLVIETQGMSTAEHNRRVGWAEKNLLSSNQDMTEAFVATVILDERGKVARFTGNGHGAADETEAILRDLIEEEDS